MNRLLILLFLLIGLGLQAQVPEDYASEPYYSIVLEDESEIVGTILEQFSDRYRILSIEGDTSLVRVREIRIMQPIDTNSMVDGVYWFANASATRNLLIPTAIPLKRNQKIYENNGIFLNRFTYGITNNISVEAGIEIISTALSAVYGEAPPFFLRPKISYKLRDKFHVGGTLLFANFPKFDTRTRRDLGIVSVLGTYGSSDNNVTLNLGWGYVEGVFLGIPIINVAAQKRVKRRLSLITENWLIPANSASGYYGVYSYGFRILLNRVAVDLSLFNNKDIASFIPIGVPFGGLVISF